MMLRQFRRMWPSRTLRRHHSSDSDRSSEINYVRSQARDNIKEFVHVQPIAQTGACLPVSREAVLSVYRRILRAGRNWETPDEHTTKEKVTTTTNTIIFIWDYCASKFDLSDDDI